MSTTRHTRACRKKSLDDIRLICSIMEHLVNKTGCSRENPIMLIMDNHSSHTSLQALSVAKENGIVLLILPPHCTHKMQPLDVGIFSPFMAYYNQAVSQYHTMHPGEKIDIYNIAAFVGEAHTNAMTIRNIQSAFRKVGIFPFNPSVFNDAEFLPSMVDESTSDPKQRVDNSISGERAKEVSLQDTPTAGPSNAGNQKMQTPEMIRPHPKNLKEKDPRKLKSSSLKKKSQVRVSL